MRIIHFFNWRLQDIIPNLDKVREQGFEAIQINPIQPLKEDGLKEWWMSYQPIDFAIGNYFGTKEDLILLCQEAEKREIRIFADVVINHMGSSPSDDLSPHPKVNPLLRSKEEYWRVRRRVENWHDRREVIHHCINLPGLNVYHPDIEDRIVSFLNELIDCGVTGFRFDAAKSIGLPSEGYRFWPNLIYRLKMYGLFLYGEVIFEENRNVIDEYADYMNVLGNYDGSNPSKMVKFVESHDTFLSNDNMGYTRHLPSETIARSYRDLTPHYEHTLFYVRPWDDTWKGEEVRKANLQKREKEFVKRYG